MRNGRSHLSFGSPTPAGERKGVCPKNATTSHAFVVQDLVEYFAYVASLAVPGVFKWQRRFPNTFLNEFAVRSAITWATPVSKRLDERE